MRKATRARAKPAPKMRAPWKRRRVSNWREYQDVIEDFLTGDWLFRGVASVRHSLVPSVGRVRPEFSYSEAVEAALFEQFKREALPLLPSRPQNDWEWLALAQHFGTPTRLLDWSETPYVSLFFAVWANDEDDAGLYIIRKPSHVDEPKDGPFRISDVSFFYPGYVTARLVNQRGIFTVHPRPAEAYTPPDMLQIVIDRASKPEFRRKLDTAGIHHAAIYPDLEGLSRRLVAVQGYRSLLASARLREEEELAATSTLPPPPPPKIDPRDPQKGQWGMSPEENDWQLSAAVTEIEEDWFAIVLTVVSTRKDRTPRGPVEFHLHDSFLEPVRTVKFANGRARLELSAFGAFTVGALIEQDGTELELDLAQLASAPPRFREQ